MFSWSSICGNHRAGGGGSNVDSGGSGRRALVKGNTWRTTKRMQNFISGEMFEKLSEKYHNKAINLPTAIDAHKRSSLREKLNRREEFQWLDTGQPWCNRDCCCTVEGAGSKSCCKQLMGSQAHWSDLLRSISTEFTYLACRMLSHVQCMSILSDLQIMQALKLKLSAKTFPPKKFSETNFPFLIACVSHSCTLSSSFFYFWKIKKGPTRTCSLIMLVVFCVSIVAAVWALSWGEGAWFSVKPDCSKLPIIVSDLCNHCWQSLLDKRPRFSSLRDSKLEVRNLKSLLDFCCDSSDCSRIAALLWLEQRSVT